MKSIPEQSKKIQRYRRRLAANGTQWFIAALTPWILGTSAVSGLLITESAQAALEEVVVTARRREESLQEVPIAVTAFSDDYLRTNNIGQLADIRTHVPSLGVSVGGSSTNTPIISLRGQRPSEVMITLDPAVPLYFGSVPLTPTQGTNIAMYDLGSVQVLKGPQGTLFGRNSTGGAVLFDPKQPSDELSGYFETKMGDYDLYSAEGAINVPVNDSLMIRLSGTKTDRDGYQTNVADNALKGKKYWDEHSQGVRLSILFEPSESFSNLTLIDWGENKMNARVPTPVAFNPGPEAGKGGLCSFCNNPNVFFNTGVPFPNTGKIDAAIAEQAARDWQKVSTDYDARETVQNTLAANTTTIEINDTYTLKNILAYRRLEFENDFDIDGTALPMFGSITTGGADPATIGLVTHKDDFQASTVDSEQFSEEIQLLINAMDDRLELILGGFYFHMDGSEVKNVQLLPLNNLVRESPAGDTENTAYAVFGEGTFEFSDKWSATLGLRYTLDKREIRAENRSGRGLSVRCLMTDQNNDPILDTDSNPLDLRDTDGDGSDICFREESEDFSAVTWRAVGTYKPQDGMMFYGSVATGYRTGGFNLRGENDVGLAPFEEETVLTYELGSKIDWEFDSGVLMRTNLALYWQDYDDIQKTQTCASCGFGTETINAGAATVKGAELELWLQPFEGLEFNLSYAYVDAGYDEWMVVDPTLPVGTIPGPGDFVDVSHRPFTWIADHSGTASIKYTLPLDEEIGDISFKVSYYAQSEVVIYADAKEFTHLADNTLLNDSITEDGYELIDYRIDWTNVMQSNFDLAVWMKNANDEQYATGGLNVLDSLGWAAEVYGAPRTVGASLRYQF